jgi:peptide/nickel transport system permease protein
MTLLKEFILPRIMQWVVVVFVGVTLTFLIPRLSPVNPVDQAINRLSSFQTLDPDAALALRQSIEDLYGLNGTVFEQYFSFWGRVLRGDLGPSFLAFPTPVSQMIGTSIGWTAGLLGVTTLISWSLGDAVDRVHVGVAAAEHHRQVADLNQRRGSAGARNPDTQSSGALEVHPVAAS